MWRKTQRLSKDSNADVLTQLKEDLNTGYHLFNAKFGRYWTRKQQFTDLIANQQIYQTPIDAVKVLVVTALVTETYEPPLEPVRSEYDWRLINTTKSYKTNWPTYYFPIGDDEISIWPIPSQDVTNGMRYVYQPQDHDLSIDDTTSTSSGATVSIINADTLVTASAGVFTQNMIGLSFQLTGVTDLSSYEILDVPTSDTLTLKSPFVGPSTSEASWRIGQTMIVPQEYADAPMHYALWNFFSSNGNESRADYHNGKYQDLVTQCMEDYSSSNESSVITDNSDYGLNTWLLPPTAT